MNIRLLSGNLGARGNRQAIGEKNKTHFSKHKSPKATGPTFCNVKADAAVNEVFPGWRAANF